MSGESCTYALDISEHLFHLTTESLRLHSNETKRYQSLTNLLDNQIAGSGSLDDCAPDTIRQHLSAIPTTGNIRIDLTFTESSAGSLDDVKERLTEILGSDLTIGDTLSILLFHYVVDRKAKAVLERLAIEDTLDALKTAAANDATSGNVLPIR